jgi:hypothetical protein
MRFLARVSRKAIVLSLAGLGLYKAWEMALSKSNRLCEQAAGASNRVRSAVRQAEADVAAASHQAAGTVIDASRIAVAEVAEVVADTALGEGASPAPTSSQSA